MVATGGSVAGSAASSMKIKGSLDTTNIDRGFTRVGKGFESVKGKSKSFGSDMMRVSSVVGGLAKKLIFLGIAGGTALVGLASKAPAVAPALAKMSVSFGKITRSLGEALAPAFERVSGWMDKLAIWVDDNKEKIGEVADKFLDWGAAIGEKVWPYLEKIGSWAAEHPGLFTGIVAGLALAPAVISGISTISSLVTLLGGTGVSASVLSAFGYIAVIATAGYGLAKGVEYLDNKTKNWLDMGTDPNVPTDMSGQTMFNRLPEKIGSYFTGQEPSWKNEERIAGIYADMKDPNYQPSGGYMRAATAEESQALQDSMRRNWFMRWWDRITD